MRISEQKRNRGGAGTEPYRSFAVGSAKALNPTRIGSLPSRALRRPISRGPRLSPGYTYMPVRYCFLFLSRKTNRAEERMCVYFTLVER